MGVRALWAFFFCLLPKKKWTKKFHTKKSTSSVFSSFKKKKKMSEQQQQPASSPPNANRLYVGNIPWSTTVEELQALFADATSVEIPTVRFFVFVFCRCASIFFIPGLSFGGHKARFAEKSDDDGDQNRDCADSFDDKKNDDDGFAHPIVAEGSTRRHVAGPPSLSLSTGDDDDDVNDESPKSEEKDGTSRVDDFGFCTTGGETKRDRGASFRLRRR